MSAARQLPLPFPVRAHYAAEDFIAAPSNEAARVWLARAADWPSGRLVLFGPPGRGKTHLAHVWRAQNAGALWNGAALRDLPALPQARAIALDDADLADETALFHLINAAAETGRALLLTARTAPAQWTVSLPDLASRLRASAAVGIGAAEDELLRKLLARLLAERQLDVPVSVQDWLLARLERHPAALTEAVARLDHAALASGRTISRPFAALVLAGLAAADGSDEISLPVSPAAPALL